MARRVVAREQQLPAAPSVQRRFEGDREAFGRHAEWVTFGGRYRTTDTPRQAAMTLRRLEDTLARYEADRAVEDPACMISHLLALGTRSAAWSCRVNEHRRGCPGQGGTQGPDRAGQLTTRWSCR